MMIRANRRLAAVLLAVAAFALPASHGRATTPDPAALQLASVHAAVMRLDTGTTLYRKRAERPVPIASVTKLMTALVVLESGERLDEWLEVVPRAEPPPVNAYSRIRIGSRLQRGELLRLSLMASENLASHVLASHHPGGRDAFVAAMNRTARRLGMTATRFVGPSGLSQANRSSAEDLLALLRAVHDNQRLRRYTTTGYHRARFRDPAYSLGYGNTNPLVHRGHWQVALSKTGYLDAAGRCLVMVSRIDGVPIAMVLLDSFGTRTPIGDAGRVRRWLRTGKSGSIAAAARDYEQRRSARFEEPLNSASRSD